MLFLFRRYPSFALPNSEDTGDSTACAVTDAKQVKQFHKCIIPWIGKAADRIIDTDSENSGVGYGSILRSPVNNQTQTVIFTVDLFTMIEYNYTRKLQTYEFVQGGGCYVCRSPHGTKPT